MRNTCFIAAAILLAMACTGGAKLAHRRVAPLDSGLNIDSLNDCTLAVGFKASDIDWSGKTLSCSVFSKDLYDAVEVGHMRAGDTLIYEGKPMVVNSIEESRGAKVVNGGIETGGAELAPNGGGTYRTMLMDDHSVYTELGKVRLRLAENMVVIDCGEDYHDPLDTIRANCKEYIDKLPDYRKDYFNCLNTEIVVEKGFVTEIRRRWIP